MSDRYDFSDVYSGLKDFQVRTVDYVFQRMYLDADPTRRFLVADEVGLGKTLVARGVIARVAEHLDRQGVERIDVIYICSNAEIARQNIRRLALPGFKGSAFASRLTLLPMKTTGLGESRLNFISFTPNTALDLKSSLGIADERALIYWLLKRKWPALVRTKKGPMRVFQGGMGSLGRFKSHLNYLRRNAMSTVDELIEAKFSAALETYSIGGVPVFDRFEELSRVWAYEGANNSPEARKARDRFVGELRTLLARMCVGALEPDLVILDEFQRFRHVLDPNTEAGELARSLFDYTDDATETRALLLSATPYKMYTLRGEAMEEDHYTDFLETTRFLMDGKVGDFEADLHDFSRQLMSIEPGHLDHVLETKQRIERRLSRVMCRTERLASTADRNGMLREVPPGQAPVQTKDFINYVVLDRVSNELDSQGMMEYWKSAPYFPNFWDGYQIGRRYGQALEDEPGKAAAVQRLLLQNDDALLPWRDLMQYQKLDPGNARLRALADELLDQNESWRLLWLPPSLPYYQLGGPFKDMGRGNLTKRLIFSSWTVVPKVVSTIISYEAERRMMTSRKKEGLENSPEGRERFTEPLRFPKSRTSGMSAFAFIYPSVALARLADPLVLRQELVRRGQKSSRQGIVRLAESKIRRALDQAVSQTSTRIDGPADDRWYWVAGLLLDALEESAQQFMTEDLATEVWAGSEGRSAGVGFRAHVDEAMATFDRALKGQLVIGAQPKDLGRVVALIALGAPGTVAYRSLSRLPCSDEVVTLDIQDTSARIAWGFRSLFNTPEVTQLVRSTHKSGPYWQRALKYNVEGCLQATLDEYVHVLREFEGIVGQLGPDDLRELGETIQDVVSLRSSDLHAQDPLDADNSTRRMRCRFALPFGQYRSEDESQIRRSGYVRTAFNSPFWPFVLTTTSVGQEGLDFHLYCHAVVHWNLPANPVDLEQREGRVHRYMGHALRKNLAARHQSTALNGAAQNPWESMLLSAIDERSDDESDLVPFWVYPGKAKIERHVPRIPLSREEGRLTDLRRSLALYRLVFGQPRQEELVELLKQKFSDSDLALAELINTLKVDLTPRVSSLTGR